VPHIHTTFWFTLPFAFSHTTCPTFHYTLRTYHTFYTHHTRFWIPCFYTGCISVLHCTPSPHHCACVRSSPLVHVHSLPTLPCLYATVTFPPHYRHQLLTPPPPCCGFWIAAFPAHPVRILPFHHPLTPAPAATPTPTPHTTPVTTTHWSRH